MNFVVIQNVVNKIMSKKGDKGITRGECLLDVSKDSAFVEAVGSIDSFQANLGEVRSIITNDEENETFFKIEKDLYEIMGSLYVGKEWSSGKKRIKEINDEAEVFKKRIKNLGDFLIPGENEVEAKINICRTKCRETERRIVALKMEREKKEISDFDGNVLKYFNRLSYLLNWMWRSKFLIKNSY
jgi:cob(I)alamin adenosyltransferase